jgi:integrase
VRTVELYRNLLDSYILPSLGDVPLAALTPSIVAAWHANLANDHKTTAAKAYRLLSQLMRAAVADRVLGANPCQVRSSGVERAEERPVASMAEVGALADAMPEHLRVVVLLAALCQLRRAELLGLRRRDVDLLHGTLSGVVTRTKTMAGAMIEKAPKTEAGRRTVTIPSNVLPALAAHLEGCVGLDPDSPVMVGEKGGRLLPQVLSCSWSKAREKVGRPELRLHDLRHSGLTWAAATGATVAELMKRAGHGSPAAALRYQHATADRDRALADALAGLARNADVVRLADIPRTFRGHRPRLASECVAATCSEQGAGDRDRTGMTSLEGRLLGFCVPAVTHRYRP